MSSLVYDLTTVCLNKLISTRRNILLILIQMPCCITDSIITGRGGVQLPPGNGSATDNGLVADCGASVTHAARAPMELHVKARNVTLGTLIV